MFILPNNKLLNCKTNNGQKTNHDNEVRHMSNSKTAVEWTPAVVLNANPGTVLESVEEKSEKE